MNVISDDLWLCTDCTMAAVNDDYTGLDYYLTLKRAAKRMKIIQAGLHDLGPGLVPMDEEDEFTYRECDCCGEHLAGYRHRFAILGE